MTFEKPLRKYETVIILNPDIPEAEQKEFFKRNQKTIEQFNGRINHIDTWGKRRLANPIEKFKVGTYFHATFEAKGECIAELERVMKIDDRVLRYVNIRLDDRKNLAKHVEDFHTVLAESLKREQEKEAKHQARRMASQGGGGSRGPRESSYGSKRYSNSEEDGGEEN